MPGAIAEESGTTVCTMCLCSVHACVREIGIFIQLCVKKTLNWLERIYLCLKVLTP